MVPSTSRLPAGLIRLAGGLVAGGLLAWLAIANIDWAVTLDGLDHASIPLLVLALAVESLHYPLKTLRWWRLLRTRTRLRFPTVLRAHAAGCLLGDLSPGRVGELARPIVLAASEGPIDFPFALGTSLASKTTDLFLLGCLAIASWALFDLPEWAGIPLLAAGGGAVACIVVAAVGGRRLADRIAPPLRRLYGRVLGRFGRPIVVDTLVDALGCIADAARPPIVGRHMALSLAILAMNLGSGYLVLAAAGIDASLPQVVLVQTLMSIAFILPAPPTYAGSIHFFVIQAVVLAGAGDASRGMTAGILAHAVEAGAVGLLALACVPGAVASARSRAAKGVAS